MSQPSLSFTPEEEALIQQKYQALLQDYIASPHRKKTEIIDQAFRLACHAHGLVRRRSGEPYILHPIAVARIVCKEIGLGSTSICSALLHDVVEDTEYTVEDIRRGFGDKIAQIVEGLTKISTEQVPQNIDSLQAQNIRKLLLTIGDDARVILIKIADRLHNMRTLSSMKPEKQLKIAGETSFFYAPLADRLGLFSIKTELEDLSFRYEHPEAYEEVLRKVKETEAGREDLFQRFAAPLKLRFDSMGLSYEMKTRVKGCFSIWRKMQLKGIPFEEVYDLFAVRIIFDNQDGYPEKNRCWDIYTAITEVYRNRPDRLRDWISTPKGNGYQALHLTVLGPDAQWIEVQVRSRRMDEIAEKGLAAHWRYKNSDVEEDHELEVWLDTIREVLNHPDSKGMEFLNTVHLSLYAHDITAFTPKGRPITLPINASVLDFAYAVHTDLGDTCIGAKVNHKVLPISHRLSNGDQVEILTSKMTHPEPEWLDYVSTAYAKVKIETALRRRQREAIARGEERLAKELEHYGERLSASLLNRLTYLYHFDKPDTFLRYIGEGMFTFPEDFERTLKSKGSPSSRTNRITRTITSLFGGKERGSHEHAEDVAATPIDRDHPYELSEHDGRLNYIIAPCCHPIPGDDALGILTDEGQVVVHRRSCPEATRYKTAQGDRLISTLWGHHYTPRFETTLMIRGIDSRGLLNVITQVLLEDFKVSISEIHMQAHEGIFEGRITIQVLSGQQVESICHILRRNKAIHEAYRLSELNQE